MMKGIAFFSGTRSRVRSASAADASDGCARSDPHCARRDRERAAVISRGALFRSTGKVSRCRSAHASFGSISSDRFGSAARRQLANVESVKAHQPVGLIEPMLADERRRDERQLARGIGNRAERGIIDAPQPLLAVERRRSVREWRCRPPASRRRSSACSARRARKSAPWRFHAAPPSIARCVF